MRHVILVTAALLCFASSAPAQTYQGYDDPRDLVEHWYQTFLHRSSAGDPRSSVWADQLRQGAAPNEVLAGICGTDEYYAKGGRTPEGFIRNLFADIVVRQPTPGELNYWMRRTVTGDINDPETRKDIAYDLLSTNPGSAQWSNPNTQAPPIRDVIPERQREWERARDRWRERNQYDYRRPYYPYRR
jgi:hypothetical protein